MFDQLIQAGQPAPEFTLARLQGAAFTREDLLGATTLLVFYPFAFSPVCSIQLPDYSANRQALTKRGVTLYGVSCDSTWTLRAFSESLGLDIELLSDFEPKGATCKAFGVLHPDGYPQRALVLIDPEGVIRWSWQAPSTSDPAPDASVLFEALDALGR